ncbi:probable sarcosine oxidase [Andrographis paniculata]|uniref:probable sarcosine oxidase n=1 Tax=Andrographis paniculata TaxID=175694 RepID=UPI0021E93D0E|nr:probable sarcosine oxidase [Andrographis paniculata]
MTYHTPDRTPTIQFSLTPSSPSSPPPMANSGQKFDVIVVGAGVMGSAIAYQTSKRGLKTLLLEQFDFLHHRGSSHGESRTIRATYPEDYYPAMALEASRLWEEAEAEAGYKVYFRTKHLDFGPNDNKALLAVVDSCTKNSIPYRLLNPAEVLQEFAGLFRLPEDWIGVVTDEGGVIKPTKAVAMLQTLALQNGAVLRDNAEVIEINRDGGTNEIVVSTAAGGEFRAGKCAISAGPWTRRLVKKVKGLVLPIQPLETSVHYWKISKGHEFKFTIAAGFPTFACYGVPYIYGTPSLEFPGLIKVPLHAGRLCEPEDRTWAASPAATAALRDWIAARFGDAIDAAAGSPAITQSCMYSMTPDEDYVIDFLGGEFREDVVVCGGFSGHGFKMAPAVGRIVADMVGGGGGGDRTEDDFWLARFRAGRFHGECKGNEKLFEEQVKNSN